MKMARKLVPLTFINKKARMSIPMADTGRIWASQTTPTRPQIGGIRGCASGDVAIVIQRATGTKKFKCPFCGLDAGDAVSKRIGASFSADRVSCINECSQCGFNWQRADVVNN